ncbi:hypothetical protein Bca4012_099368 [Brassica carinata]|uniref:(rape) hypothetical protein n=1 Tax=Brassica napus TaxID=3708 RepID=A0A816QBX3_BRANA|nr:unnamed protein product [Brassica napus]
MNFLYPSIFLSISRVHIHRLFRSLTSSSLSSSLHQFTLDSSPYVHLLPISSPMELTVEVSALDLLSRRWSRMKRKRKLGNVFLIWFMDFSCSRQLCIYLPKQLRKAKPLWEWVYSLGSTFMVLTCLLCLMAWILHFFSLTYITVIIVASVDSGVSVDIWTSYAVRIMAISVFPFVIV